tara:strand:- start:565 stop:780 length:216 start_codon:yes stop_codon:yes gene_type:complete
MSRKIRVRRVGGGLGVSLPKELGFEEGEELYAIRTTEGLTLTRLDPDFDRAMEASSDFIKRYPNLMKKLAE